MNFTGLLDLVDGGGAGRAGQQFEGSRISEILNAIGIKPYGAEDRMRAVRPQARPDNFRQQFTPPVQTAPPSPPLQYSGRGSVGMPPAPYSPPEQFPLGPLDMLNTMADARAVRASEGPAGIQSMANYSSTPSTAPAGGRGMVTGPSITEAFAQRLIQVFPPEQIERMRQRGDLERLYQQFVQTGQF